MESNKSNHQLGGYGIDNFNNHKLFADTKKVIHLSFKIDDIDDIDDFEILKLSLHGQYICRIMKFYDTDTNIPALIFDIVDEIAKEIILKSNKLYPNGSGLATDLVDAQQISQWEVIPLELLCKNFLIGNADSFLETIENFNIKISKSVESYIKFRMD